MPTPLNHRPLLRALTQRPVVLAAASLVCARLLYWGTTLPVFDPDVWWVAAAGREMLRTGHIPTQNLFSFTEPARPWVMHEWLFGPLYASLLAARGPAVFGLIAAACTLVALGAVLWVLLGRGRHPTASLLASLLAVVAFGARLASARPTGASIALAVLVASIALAPRFSRVAAASTVALCALWANAHGSFPLGVVLVAAGALAEPRDRARRALTAVAAAAVTLVNPYGLRLYGLIDRYVRGDGGSVTAVHRRIVEFAPLWRAERGLVAPDAALGLLLLALFGAWALRDRALRARGALVLGLVALAVWQVRHIELAGLAGLIAAQPCVDAWLDRAGLAPSPPWRAGASVAWVLAPALCAALAVRAVVTRDRTPDDWIADALGGRDGAALARALPDDARVFTPFDSAGLVLWLAFPRGVRVQYDSRNDCYSGAVAERAFALTVGRAPEATLRALIARDGAQYALLPAAHSLARALAGDPAWRTVATRGAWVVLARNAPG